jgi:hypothetical protein
MPKPMSGSLNKLGVMPAPKPVKPTGTPRANNLGKWLHKKKGS